MEMEEYSGHLFKVPQHILQFSLALGPEGAGCDSLLKSKLFSCFLRNGQCADEVLPILDTNPQGLAWGGNPHLTRGEGVAPITTVMAWLEWILTNWWKAKWPSQNRTTPGRHWSPPATTDADGHLVTSAPGPKRLWSLGATRTADENYSDLMCRWHRSTMSTKLASRPQTPSQILEGLQWASKKLKSALLRALPSRESFLRWPEC